MSDDQLLGLYLNDHLTMATGALELCRRAARSFEDQPSVAVLQDLVEEIGADRDALEQLMRRLDVTENRPLEALGWLGEKVGRFKPNGSLLRRSPLSDVVELEGLLLAVQSQLACWRVLRTVADHDPRVATGETDTLVRRAQDRARRVEELHRRAAERRLAVPPA